MTSINQGMQDNVIKASLAGSIQERDNDVQRAMHRAQEGFRDEMLRKAEEVVTEVQHAENHGIGAENEKEGSGQYGKQKKREKKEGEKDDPADGWTMGPDDDGKPHKINIIA